MTTRSFLPADTFVGWQLDEALEPDRCTALLRDLVARGFERTGGRYPANYRDNDRLVFDDPVLADTLYRELRDRLPHVLGPNGLPVDDTTEAAHSVDGGERWELVGLNARFRACRYAGGQSFRIHRDGPYAPGDDVRSFLTIQFYLDDDPARSGGTTRFYDDANGSTTWASIAPRTGTAIVFDHRAWHDGEPVTAGIKHVLRTDAVYRRAIVGLRARASRAESTSARSSGGDRRSGGDAPLASELGRHRGYAWQATVLRDGTVASAGRDGTLRWWKTPPRTLELAAGSITCLVEDSRDRLWCGTRAGDVWRSSRDGVVRIATGLAAITHGARCGELVAFTTSTGDIVAFHGAAPERAESRITKAHDGWTWGIAGDRDGFLSCGHDGRVVRIDRDGRAGVIAQLGAPLRAIATTGSPRAPAIVVGDERGWLYWLARDGCVIRSFRAHRAAVTSIAIGKRVVSASEDGTVRSRDHANVEDRVLLEASDFITSVAFDADGDLIVAGYDGAIRRVRTA